MKVKKNITQRSPETCQAKIIGGPLDGQICDAFPWRDGYFEAAHDCKIDGEIYAVEGFVLDGKPSINLLYQNRGDDE